MVRVVDAVSGISAIDFPPARGFKQSFQGVATFATAFEVRVKDAAGKRISNAAVTFTLAPGSNAASGKFTAGVHRRNLHQ